MQQQTPLTEPTVDHPNRPSPVTHFTETNRQVSQEELLLERLQGVLQAVRSAMPSTVLTVVLLLSVMSAMVPAFILVTWGIAQAICQSGRYLFIRWAQDHGSAATSARGLLAVTLVESTLWGTTAIVFQPTHLPHQIALYVLLNIICSVRIPIYAPLRTIQTVQIAVPVGMVLIGLCLQWTPLSFWLIVCELGWLANLIRLSRRIGRATDGSLRLRLENASLVVALQKALDQVRQLAVRDALTGIYNRYHLIEVLQREIDNHQRTLTPVTIALLDVDHFKSINDTHGHLTGDQVLQEVVACIKSQIRSVDTLARYGGEEFVCILPNTPEEAATIVAERIRLAVCEAPLPIDDLHIMASVSIGLAEYAPGELLQSWLGRADQALYRAKQNGRNRFERAENWRTNRAADPGIIDELPV